MTYINQAFTHFTEFQKNIKCHSDKTLLWYRHSLKCLVESVNIEMIEDITPQKLYQFIQWGREQQKWSAHTLHTRLRAIKAFLNWARKNHYTTINPFEVVDFPKLPIQVKDILSIGQVKVILNFLLTYKNYSLFQRLRNHAIVALFLHTGIRRGELLHLDVSDINLIEGVLHVREGKGQKDRLITLNSEIVTVLSRYMQEREKNALLTPAYFFGLTNETRLTQDSIRRVFETTIRETGIKFNPHMLRRTFATMMLESGCDLFALQKLMGHSDVKTLINSYLKLSYDHLRKQVNRHPLVNPFS